MTGGHINWSHPQANFPLSARGSEGRGLIYEVTLTAAQVHAQAMT